MILNAIKNKWTMTAHNEVLIFSEIVMAVLILLGGKVNWLFVSWFVMTFQSCTPHAHIDYLIPITDEEMKRQRVGNIFIIAVEAALLFAAGTLISAKVYNLGTLINKNQEVIIIWAICNFVNSISNGLNMEGDRLSGLVKESVKEQLKKDAFGTVAMVLGNVLMAAMMICISLMYFLDINMGFITCRAVILIISVILVVMIINIIRKCRNITVGDYYEI